MFNISTLKDIKSIEGKTVKNIIVRGDNKDNITIVEIIFEDDFEIDFQASKNNKGYSVVNILLDESYYKK